MLRIITRMNSERFTNRFSSYSADKSSGDTLYPVSMRENMSHEGALPPMWCDISCVHSLLFQPGNVRNDIQDLTVILSDVVMLPCSLFNWRYDEDSFTGVRAWVVLYLDWFTVHRRPSQKFLTHSPALELATAGVCVKLGKCNSILLSMHTPRHLSKP